MPLYRNDDDLARYRAVFLGFRGKTFPFQARYVAYGVGTALALICMPAFFFAAWLLGFLPLFVSLLLGAVGGGWAVTRMLAPRLLDSYEGSARTTYLWLLRIVTGLFSGLMAATAAYVHPVFAVPWGVPAAVILTVIGLRWVDTDRPISHWKAALLADWHARRRAPHRVRFVARYKTVREGVR